MRDMTSYPLAEHSPGWTVFVSAKGRQIEAVRASRRAGRVSRIEPCNSDLSSGRLSYIIFERQHPVHHLAGKPEIARGVAHLVELGPGQVLGNIAVLRQQLDQRLASRGHLAANVVDEVVGALASEMRTEPHH